MSTSLVHVLKLIGPRARQLTVECERLASRRTPKEKLGLSSEDWSAEDGLAIDALCVRLLEDPYQLPIVYFAQYLDSWSVAGSSLQWVKSHGYAGRLWSESWIVWYHSLPDRGFLARRVTAVRRNVAFRSEVESRWLLDHVSEAANYASGFNRPALLLALIKPIASSRTDDQYRRSLIDIL